ncbi:MAG: GNAT family N-acetyltransferase [Pseudomonadota bacterium]
MTPERVFAAIDGTWPPARMIETGPWMCREGRGGGQRVSAISARAGVCDADIPHAEAQAAALGQAPLFLIRPGDDALDDMLAARGYVIHDPVRALACAPAQLTGQPVPPVMVFEVWKPLAIMCELWMEGGIGPGRIAVMERASGPKTALLGRMSDKPAAVAYIAIHDRVAMLHALEVRSAFRRQGLAQWMMRAAAIWAQAHGADTLVVLCTRVNEAANRLYATLSMTEVTAYHYRRSSREDL